jgi:hypothetical protein
MWLKKGVSSPDATGYGQRFWPFLAKIWVGAVIVTFLVVRILGSNSFKQIAHAITGR